MNRVERGIEHADDFRGFVVDDGVPLLVPEHGHAYPAAVMRIGQEIDSAERRLAIDAVDVAPGSMPNSQPCLAEMRLGHRDRDDVLKLLELAEDEGAGRPRAGERDVEVVAAGFGGESSFAGRAGAAVGRDVVVEGRGRSDEVAVLGSGNVLLPGAVDKQSHYRLR